MGDSFVIAPGDGNGHLMVLLTILQLFKGPNAFLGPPKLMGFLPFDERVITIITFCEISNRPPKFLLTRVNLV